jgi:hypothetical protein
LKILFTIISCIALGTFVFGQDSLQKVGITMGEKSLLSNSIKGYPTVVGHDSGSFYVLKNEYVSFMDRYDTALNLSKESEFLKVDYKLQDRHLDTVIFFQDSLYMFYYESKFLKTNIYVRTLDKNTLERSANERLIAEVAHFKGNFPELHFEMSLLHNKLALVVQTNAYLQKTIKFDFLVFDQGLDVVWQKTDFFQYNYQAPREMNFTVDEVGNIHILSLIYKIRFINHVLADDPLKNEYMVVSYINKGQERIKNNIALEGQFIRGIRLIAGTNATFICAGFYSQLYRFGIKGAFFVSNNTPSKAIEPILYNPFSEAMIEDLPEKDWSPRTNEIYSFQVRELVYRKNGNIVLCGEQVYRQNYNNYNNIIIVAFNPFGNILWNRTIEKIQSGNEFVSFSVVAPVFENDVKILYNENQKNPVDGDVDKRKSFHFSARSYLVLATVDPFGNIQKEKLMARNKRELAPMPMNTYDMRNGEVVMLFNRYRKYKFGRISLF